ncbi:MAG: hypothetical protein AAGI91_10310 [Bacteroidota bacterium]
MTLRTDVPAVLRRPAALALALFMLAAAGCDSSDPEPTTGTISGTISLPAGAAGDVDNTLVALYETLDEFRNNAPTFEVTASADGSYEFTNINPDSYFLAAFKDNDNSQGISSGDFYGYLGGGPLDPDEATPQRQQVTAGENVGINFVIQIVPPGFGVTLTGTYSGNVEGSTLTLNLAEVAGVITGTGSLSGAGSSLPLTASGTFAPPSVTINLSSPGFDPFTLTGIASDDGSVITGNLNGSGFTGESVTLTRP